MSLSLFGEYYFVYSVIIIAIICAEFLYFNISKKDLEDSGYYIVKIECIILSVLASIFINILLWSIIVPLMTITTFIISIISIIILCVFVWGNVQIRKYLDNRGNVNGKQMPKL